MQKFDLWSLKLFRSSRKRPCPSSIHIGNGLEPVAEENPWQYPSFKLARLSGNALAPETGNRLKSFFLRIIISCVLHYVFIFPSLPLQSHWWKLAQHKVRNILSSVSLMIRLLNPFERKSTVLCNSLRSILFYHKFLSIIQWSFRIIIIIIISSGSWSAILTRRDPLKRNP